MPHVILLCTGGEGPGRQGGGAYPGDQGVAQRGDGAGQRREGDASGAQPLCAARSRAAAAGCKSLERG